MSVERIQLPQKEIILVGTAHISQASIQLVQKTIENEKPDFVGIELDSQRFSQLKDHAKWQNTNVHQVIREGKTYLLLLNIFLSNLQRRLGENVQVKPGQEMMAAVETAAKNGISVALLDRDISITLKRAFSLMPFFEKIKIGWYFLSGFFSEKEEITPEKIE